MRISSQEQNPTIIVPSFSSESINGAYYDTIVSTLSERRIALDMALSRLMTQTSILTDIAARLIETLRSGHKVLVVGNGGSAAEAQHFAAELVGRFKRDRTPYAVLALTTDTSILTAVANDYGYQEVFARQVTAFGQPRDLLLAFSTSGESENILHAAQAGHACHMTVVAITGELSNRLEMVSDVTLKMPLCDTALVQELHMIVTHILCDIVEMHLSSLEEAIPVGTDVARTFSSQDEWSL
jgi:D-sedoheptulose 7-phosphate isomerase